VRRRLFTLASCAGLLLCLAACIQWFRGRHYADVVWRVWVAEGDSSVTGRKWMLRTGYDGILLIRVAMQPPEPPRQTAFRTKMASMAERGWFIETSDKPLSLNLAPQRPIYATGPGEYGELLGVQYLWAPRPGEDTMMLKLPFWLLLAVTAATPGAWVIVRIWNRCRAGVRRRGGLCTQCGYDLKGNASGICPECGSAVKGNKEAVR